MEGGDFLFYGAEVRVAAIVSLDVGVNSPVLSLLEFFNDEGISVGVGLDVTEEPGWERFGDVVIVDARGGIEVLNEDGVVRSSGSPHDTALVNVFDVAGLHGEPVDDNGEVGHLPTIFFKSLWAFDSVSILVCVEAALEVFDGGSAPSSDHF